MNHASRFRIVQKAIAFCFFFLMFTPSAHADDVYYTNNVAITREAFYPSGMAMVAGQPITIPRGTPLRFERDPFTGIYSMVVERMNASRLERGYVSFTQNEMTTLFGEPSSANRNGEGDFVVPEFSVNGRDRYIRIEREPRDLGINRAHNPIDPHFIAEVNFPTRLANNTGMTIEIQESRVIPMGRAGTPTLVQRICYHRTGELGLNRPCGWVRGDAIRKNTESAPNPNFTAGLEPITRVPNVPCPPRRPQNVVESTRAALATVAAVVRPPPPTTAQRLAAIESTIGTCVVDPDLRANRLNIDRYNTSNANIYDQMVMPRMRRTYPYSRRGEESQAPMMTLANGARRRMTQDDYFAIDALARTLYAEMRSCARPQHGDIYAQAVARVIINRTSNLRQFGQGPQAITNPIGRAALGNRQFSCWNNSDEIRARELPNHLNNMLDALCPRNSRSTQESRAVWDRMVRISMDAVMNQQQFMNRTNGLRGYLFYTSAMQRGSPWRELPDPQINGQRLHRDECTRFWSDR